MLLILQTVMGKAMVKQKVGMIMVLKLLMALCHGAKPVRLSLTTHNLYFGAKIRNII